MEAQSNPTPDPGRGYVRPFLDVFRSPLSTHPLISRDNYAKIQISLLFRAVESE